MKKYNIEDVRAKFLECGYTLTSTEYKNTKSKISFVCNKHIDFGEQYTTFAYLIGPRKSNCLCKICQNENGRPHRRFSEEKARKLCEERGFEFIGLKFENYSNGSNRSIIQFVCNKHKDKGVQEVVSYSMKKNKGCKYCAGLCKTTKDFIKELNDPNIELLEDYKGAFTKIKCFCKIHNVEWMVRPDNLRSGCRCPECKRQRKHNSQVRTTEEYIAELKMSNPNIELLEPYKTANEKLRFRCTIHNYEWEAIPQKLLYRHCGCPKCGSYNNEFKLHDILTSWGYKVELQKRFIDCKDKSTLPFDVYLPDYNICIEYDGEQHYIKNKFEWRNSSHSSFDLIQLHDSMKTKYCLEHEIPLIRIPYWEADNMESFLFDEMAKYGAIEIKETV